MHTFSIDRVGQRFIGFDKLLAQLSAQSQGDQNKYPPYNIVQQGELNYRITMAVAGFKEDELSIVQSNHDLLISGSIKDTAGLGPDEQYLHRGIATRDFARTFTLGEHVTVTGAEYAQGLLTVSLERQVPDKLKPQQIAITYNK